MQLMAVAFDKFGPQNFAGDQCQILCGRNAIQQDCLVPGNGCQKVTHNVIGAPAQKGVIPRVNDQFFGDGLDVCKIANHAIVWLARLIDDVTLHGDFEHIAMAMQVATLAEVIGNPMSGIEFQAAGNQHEVDIGTETRAPGRISISWIMRGAERVVIIAAVLPALVSLVVGAATARKKNRAPKRPVTLTDAGLEYTIPTKRTDQPAFLASLAFFLSSLKTSPF